MSDFKARMHQIRFQLGLPQTPMGELTALRQTPKLNLRGPTSKGKMGNGRERGRGKGRTGRAVADSRGSGRGMPPLLTALQLKFYFI